MTQFGVLSRMIFQPYLFVAGTQGCIILAIWAARYRISVRVRRDQ
jgi:hypothetical protein